MNVQTFQRGKVITLYDAFTDPEFRGELVINPLINRHLTQASDSPWLFKNLIIISLLIFSVVGALTLAFPIAVSELSYRFTKPQPLAFENKIKDNLNAVSPAPLEPAKNLNDFSITIPKINLSAKVIPNVDITNESLYKDQLKEGVAHALGSYLPGENGPVFLFAHSTDSVEDISKYNAEFFAVKDLKVGDEIDLHFSGADYRYKITNTKVISPSDLSFIKNSHANLILSTCFPPGTDWQRLVVEAATIN